MCRLGDDGIGDGPFNSSFLIGVDAWILKALLLGKFSPMRSKEFREVRYGSQEPYMRLAERRAGCGRCTCAAGVLEHQPAGGPDRYAR